MRWALQRLFWRRRWRCSWLMSLRYLLFTLPLLIWQAPVPVATAPSTTISSPGKGVRVPIAVEDGEHPRQHDNGEAWIETWTAGECAPYWTVTLWVANQSFSQWTGGTATLRLPVGMALDDGETSTKSIGNVPANTTTRVSWQLQLQSAVTTTHTLDASTQFIEGPHLIARTEISTLDCLPTDVAISDVSGIMVSQVRWPNFVGVAMVVSVASLVGMKVRARRERQG